MFDKKHPILGSQHADVLTAEPETEDAKASLVEEIKNRARWGLEGALSSRVCDWKGQGG